MEFLERKEVGTEKWRNRKIRGRVVLPVASAHIRGYALPSVVLIRAPRVRSTFRSSLGAGGFGAGHQLSTTVSMQTISRIDCSV